MITEDSHNAFIHYFVQITKYNNVHFFLSESTYVSNNF